MAGKYVFKLTVKDEQGLSDEDVVNINVLDGTSSACLFFVLTSCIKILYFWKFPN